MGIREVKYRAFDPFGDPDFQPHAIWDVDISNCVLRVERYGSMCGWDKIKIKKNERERYKITLNPRYSNGFDMERRVDIGKRQEFFFNRLRREYYGNQFSFIEFLNICGRLERIPLFGEVQMKLDSRIERLYRKSLYRMILSTG